MAAPTKTYDQWLSYRLIAANPDVDLEIFVSYINGILETDTSSEDKRESLEDVLEQVVEDGREELCAEIIRQWDKENSDASASKGTAESLDARLSEMMGQAAVSVVKTRLLTDEEKERKAAILSQYDHVSDGEEEDAAGTDHGGGVNKAGGGKGGGASAKGGGGAATNDDWYARNTNSISVLDAEKEKREKSKQEHEKKKDKDKVDREAQRQKQTDRKETEKKRTQKGERRR